MTVKEQTEKGVTVSVSWSSVVAFIAFVVLIGPGLFYVGRLHERVMTQEKKVDAHIESGGHPGMERRMAIVETRLSRIPVIEDQIRRVLEELEEK